MKTKIFKKNLPFLSILRKFNNKKACQLMTVMLFIALSILLNAYKSGSPIKNTNAPGENSCYESPACHSGTPNTGPGYADITVMGGLKGNKYTPGKTYMLMPYTRNTGNTIIGFQTVAVLLNGDPAGKVSILSPSVTQVYSSGGYEYVTHMSAGTVNPGEHDWMYDWEAPPAGSGSVVIYGAFISADGDGTEKGDKIYTDSLVLYEDTTNDIKNDFAMLDFNINNIYPNPVKQIINIDVILKKREQLSIEIVNIEGKAVMQNSYFYTNLSGNTYQINVESLETGIYFVKVKKHNNQSIVKKFIKIDA